MLALQREWILETRRGLWRRRLRSMARRSVEIPEQSFFEARATRTSINLSRSLTKAQEEVQGRHRQTRMMEKSDRLHFDPQYQNVCVCSHTAIFMRTDLSPRPWNEDIYV